MNLAGPAQNTGEAVGDQYLSIEGLIGSAFNDTLVGDDAANTLQGGGGNDYLQARGGADTLQGGEGNDFLEGGTGADTLNGGTGFDYAAYYYATTGATVDLLTPSNNFGAAAGDSFISIEGVIGTTHNDFLRGDNNANDLAGSDGADELLGRGGNDNLQGMNGNDTLDGGAGADRLVGGDGGDTFSFHIGEADGDTVADFAGTSTGATGLHADELEFHGYGTIDQGASFTPVDATHWSINSANGQVHEIITFTNAAVILPIDYIFI